MDVIAKRVKARNLEVEGRLQEALDVYRDILAHEPTSELLLPIAVQASELSVVLGDRNAGVSVLLAAADRYAEAGLGWQVIDLHQRIRRLDPSRRGLDLRLARRMLERRHPQAAREFLADLARRFKKEKLRQVLAKMEGWSDEEVQRRLTAFLDRAEGIRESATATTTEPPPAVPAPPQDPPEQARRTVPMSRAASVPESVSSPPPVSTQHPAPRRPVPADAVPADAEAPVVDRTTGPRRIPRASPPAVEPAGAATVPAAAVSAARASAPPTERAPIASEPVLFVMPDAPAPTPASVPPAPRRFDRRRKTSRIPSLAVAAVVIIVAGSGGLFLGIRLGGGEGGPRVSGELAAQVTTSGSLRAVPIGDVPDPVPADPVAPPVVGQIDSGAAGGPRPGPATAQAPVAAVAVPEPEPVRQPPPGGPARTPAVAPPPVATAALSVPPPTVRDSTPPPAVTRQPQPVAPPAQSAARVPPAAAPPPVPAPAPATPAYGVDYPFVMVEGLAIADITQEGSGAASRIVVRQLLPSGDTLQLSASNLGASSVGVGGGRLLVSRHPSGGAMGTVRVGPYLVSARALVAPEVLEPFLRRMVEVVPE